MGNRINVSVGWDLSVTGLSELRAAGHFVPRSYHLGNQYPSNLLVTMLEAATPLIYERTIVDGDDLMNPNYLISGRKPQKITNDRGLLTPFADFSSSYKPNGWGEKNPGHLHYMSIKKLRPDAQIFSEWFEQHRDVVTVVLETLISAEFSVFNRYITEEGEIWLQSENNRELYFNQHTGESRLVPDFDKVASFWKLNRMIRDRVVDGADYKTDGVIFHNYINVLIDIVVAALNGFRTIYHTSGPSMYRYIGGYELSLNAMYETLLDYGMKLPESVSYVVVPTAVMDFLVPEQDRLILDELVGRYQELRELQQQKEGKTSWGDGEEAGLDRKIRRADNKFKAVRVKYQKRGLRTNTKKRRFWTQYDLHSSSFEEFYHPESLLDMTFREVAGIMA